MKNDKTVRQYETAGGVKVYTLPVEAFPNHVTNCYLILERPVTLLDTGSGWDNSNQDLVTSFETLRYDFGEKVTMKDVDRVIITHGHIDHFGGVNFVGDECAADLGIHELDRSVIQRFRERMLVSSTNVHRFLRSSGQSDDHVNALLQMNKWSKDRFQARPVDFTFDEGPLEGGLETFHVPGHCPGQVCLRLDDILFTADHVLSRITPNQSPESITRYTGLGHYMQSLRKIREMDGIRLGLGGHEDPMEDLQGRIDDTLAFHEARLEKTLEILREPMNIAQASLALFGDRMDYHILLAMLETAAHIEYLYERDRLVVTNYAQAEHELNPVLVYQQA